MCDNIYIITIYSTLSDFLTWLKITTPVFMTEIELDELLFVLLGQSSLKLSYLKKSLRGLIKDFQQHFKKA